MEGKFLYVWPSKLRERPPTRRAGNGSGGDGSSLRLCGWDSCRHRLAEGERRELPMGARRASDAMHRERNSTSSRRCHCLSS